MDLKSCIFAKRKHPVQAIVNYNDDFITGYFFNWRGNWDDLRDAPSAITQNNPSLRGVYKLVRSECWILI